MDIAIFSDHGAFLFRYFHIIGGVAWIGVLWYINFIQGGYVGGLDAAGQTVAKQKLFPKVMWYFRYGALLTFITGVALIGIKGFDPISGKVVGSDVWNAWFAKIYPGFMFATIMFLNVWFVIWPRQKKVIAAANGEKIDGVPAMARRGFHRVTHQHAALSAHAVLYGCGTEPDTQRRQRREAQPLDHRDDGSFSAHRSECSVRE
jgi:uncharacterized membrane protein